MTTDPDYLALLKAVTENVADDLPRLVLADWLDEHGQPDWAEFIRVQCRLFHMTEDERQTPEGSELRLRQYAVQGCIPALLPDFPDLVQDTVNGQGMWYANDIGGTIRFCFRRGFVAEVRCNYLTWLAGIGLIVTVAHPVEVVHTDAVIVTPDGETDDWRLSELLVAWAKQQTGRPRNG